MVEQGSRQDGRRDGPLLFARADCIEGLLLATTGLHNLQLQVRGPAIKEQRGEVPLPAQLIQLGVNLLQDEELRPLHFAGLRHSPCQRVQVDGKPHIRAGDRSLRECCEFYTNAESACQSTARGFPEHGWPGRARLASALLSRSVMNRLGENSRIAMMTLNTPFVRAFTDREKAALANSHFKGINLDGVDFAGADLRHASFHDVSLIGCDFRNADLRCARFARCDLQRTLFHGARWDCNQLQDSMFLGAQGLEPTTVVYLQSVGGRALAQCQ